MAAYWRPAGLVDGDACDQVGAGVDPVAPAGDPEPSEKVSKLMSRRGTANHRRRPFSEGVVRRVA
jgi:hypothetical protein